MNMSINIYSATNHGLDGVLINVEVDIMRGIPSFHMVGLPEASVKEARGKGFGQQLLILDILFL